MPVFEPAGCDEAGLLARGRAGLVDGDEAIRVGEGKRLEQHRVDEREDGGRDAGAERQRDDRRGEIRRAAARAIATPGARPRSAATRGAARGWRAPAASRTRQARRPVGATGCREVLDLVEEQGAHGKRSAPAGFGRGRFEGCDHLGPVGVADIAGHEDEERAVNGARESSHCAASRRHDCLRSAGVTDGRTPRSCACRTSASSRAVSALSTARPSGSRR